MCTVLLAPGGYPTAVNKIKKKNTHTHTHTHTSYTEKLYTFQTRNAFPVTLAVLGVIKKGLIFIYYNQH